MGNSSATSGQIVKCPSCGAANRVSPQQAGGRQAVCGKCGTLLTPPAASRPSSANGPLTVTDANFESLVSASAVPVVLDLWAAWCGPCRIVAPTIDSLARELGQRALVCKLDVDANPRTAARFAVSSIPTILILSGGREVDRMIGVQSREAILSRLQRFL
ncbi:MAG: thioredoxin [Pyrinomonadaceae bacterium]